MKKKVFLVLLLCLLSLSKSKIGAKGITRTGHSEIQELDFYDENAGYRILNQMSSWTIKNAYKKVKRKAFGWNVYAINKNIPIWYIAETVFSRSNATSRDIVFNYTLSMSQTEELEVSVSGSIAGKASGKIKSISASLDTQIRGEVKKASKTYYEEETSFQLLVPKNHKVSLLIRGDASISNGVGRYYIFGICTKKGTWEYIDIETEYYELFEEEL